MDDLHARGSSDNDQDNEEEEQEHDSHLPPPHPTSTRATNVEESSMESSNVKKWGNKKPTSDVWLGLSEESSAGKQPMLTQETFGCPVVAHKFDQTRADRKCVEWVILAEQSFKAVEHPALVSWIHNIAPRYKMPNRKKIALLVLELFMTEKAKIMSVIEDVRVSVTTDIWTSLQNINYMVVTAHFLDHEWNPHKRIISFTKITSHKGDNIGRVLDECLQQWNITKVFSITVENASANDKAIDYMKRRLESRNTLLLDGVHLHMRCACHIINLIVNDGMKELNPSIEAIRNCVKYIHSSAARLDEFRKMAVLEGFDKSSSVPLDIVTRWNSTYQMLRSALKYKRVFARMAEESANFTIYFDERDARREGPPIKGDWDKAKVFAQFLKKFDDATKALSASLTPTIHLVLDEIFEIQRQLMRLVDDDRNTILKRVAEIMKEKFEKYWVFFDGVVPIMYVATMLNPQNKMDLIRLWLRKLNTSEEKTVDVEKAVRKHLYDLYYAYKDGGRARGSGSVAVESTSASASANIVGAGNDIDDDDIFKEDTKMAVRREMTEMRKASQQEEIKNEVDKYEREACEDVLNGDFNVLAWWKENAHRYPVLAKVAKDVFALPSSMVTSESAFSLGGRIVDPFRASLTPKMVEALVCANDWLRGKDFDFLVDMTEEEEVEFYNDLEGWEFEAERAQHHRQRSSNMPLSPPVSSIETPTPTPPSPLPTSIPTPSKPTSKPTPKSRNTKRKRT